MKRNILIALFTMCMSFTVVNASSLVQMDVQKVSDSDIDVTFFATEVADSPIVTRKSDNKYVVLMPNVKSENVTKPDISSFRDVITDVDIKNIDDGLGGYTKVTFITKQPIKIRTNIKKTFPLSNEEEETRNLISAVKMQPVQHKNTTNAIDINKAATQSIAQINKPQKEVAKTVTSSSKKVSTDKKNKISVLSSKKNNLSKSTTTSKVVVNTPLKEDLKIETKLSGIIDEKKLNTESVSEADKINVKNVMQDNSYIDAKKLEEIEKILLTTEQPPKKINFGIGFVLLPILGLYLLARIVRNSVKGSEILKASFREHLAKQPITQGTYEDIINAQELNWQERYQQFLNESKREVKNKNYKFISIPKVEKSEVTETKEIIDVSVDSKIEERRQKLEEIFIESEKSTDIEENTEAEMISLPSLKDVFSEDEIIQKNLKHIKLKSFARGVSLEMSSRNRVKKALPKAHNLTAGKYVELQESALNKSVRRFQGANLRVADLINTGNQYIHEKEKGLYTMKKNYIMSSMDEYFALLDKEQVKGVSYPNKELSSKVAASLAKVKPSMSIQQSNMPKHISNPISQKRENTLNGLIVKSGYAIDENRGFYIVNLDGTMALIGRSGDDINVLKKFDTPVDNLQVRHDSENVYMVKAGDFKSLVDVDEMGVLIEL